MNIPEPIRSELNRPVDDGAIRDDTPLHEAMEIVRARLAADGDVAERKLEVHDTGESA